MVNAQRITRKKTQMNSALGRVALLALCLVSAPVVLTAEEPAVISLSTQITLGSYNNSAERSGYISEILALTYQRPDDCSVTVTIKDSTLNWKQSPGGIHTVEPGIGLTRWITISPEDLIGITVAATRSTGDDSNSDQMIVPYVSIMGKRRDGSASVDLGYARSNYTDTTVNQVTASYGFSFFDSRFWSRTRLYYLDLGDRPVEGMNNSTAIEQKLTWYAIPQKLSLTFSVLAGRRIHGYDPDIAAVYTVPDIQYGSGGVTIGYSVSPALHLYGDASYESYRKPSITNNYSVTYGTVGLMYVF